MTDSIIIVMKSGELPSLLRHGQTIWLRPGDKMILATASIGQRTVAPAKS